MPPIYQKSSPELYEYVNNRNLQSQWFLLETLVTHALEKADFRFSLESLFALHHAAAILLDHRPGRIRLGPVRIIGSNHEPPHEAKIEGYLSNFFDTLNKNFDNWSATKVGSYALWRLTWIHPFYECNGRTARSFAYFAMCIKLKSWPPGSTTMHQLIRQNSKDYYLGLQLADAAHKANPKIVDVSHLEVYLKKLLYLQFSSRGI